MSDNDHGTGSAAAHGNDDGHGHEEHGHASDTLGGIDWTMWSVGVLGVIVALVVTAGFVLATGFNFGA